MKNLNTKLLAFQTKVSAIKKDGKNPHFKSTYATLTQILSEVKPLLSEVGLVLTQPINHLGIGTEVICHETNERIVSYIPIPTGLNPQQMGSAITYYRRYSLAALLSLEIEDDDANMASQPTAKPAEDKQWLNKGSENYYKVLDALTNGKATIAQVESKYKLSKELKEELIKAQA